MKKYKPGTLIEYSGFEVEELIIIINQKENKSLSGHLYDVYNLSFDMFMERTEKFLDKHYNILVE